MTKNDKRTPRAPVTAKVALIGLGVTAGVLTILIVHGLHGASSVETAGRGGQGQRGLGAAPAGASLPAGDPGLAASETGAREAATTGDSPALRVPTPTPPEPQPWESTPESSGHLAPGFEPAWSVNPTRDEPSVPPQPAAPPNPIVNRPPDLNPGGVEGHRGPVPQAVSRRRANDRSSAGVRGDPGETRVRLKPDN